MACPVSRNLKWYNNRKKDHHLMYCIFNNNSNTPICEKVYNKGVSSRNRLQIFCSNNFTENCRLHRQTIAIKCSPVFFRSVRWNYSVYKCHKCCYFLITLPSQCKLRINYNKLILYVSTWQQGFFPSCFILIMMNTK